MDDLLNDFITEANESLEVLDTELVKFEQEPGDTEILGNIFRLMHTIKGTCGFLGLPRLESVAHAGENILDTLREGEIEATPDAVTSILTCIDRIREVLAGIETTGTEPEGDDSELISVLNAMASGEVSDPIAEDAENVESEADQDVASESESEPSTNAFGAPVAAELLAEVESALAAGNCAATDDEIMNEMAEETEGNEEPVELEPEPEPAVSVAKAAAKGSIDPELPGAPKTAKDTPVVQASIRVNVDVLEGLMTLVSELVLTRNQLLQMVRGDDDSEFVVPLQRLSHITTDLQEGVMKTRMQPIGNAWAKLPRIVRDLAVETGKKIDLIMNGADTELDRQVLELIKDPLTHMVRNSADHGLENSADRLAAGKPEVGSVTLDAYHEGGHINIQIRDDGRGLNVEKIREKCIERGLASAAELESMDERQIQQFIFRPGFSTAEKVTSVSGRGVGMDVVRTNIESIGGTVELQSTQGKGSTFTIKIPLTLAIVSALVVACGRERFAIPQISVLELVRTAANSELTIETINDSRLLRLRDRLLPLVSLRDLLGIEESGPVGGGSQQSELAIGNNGSQTDDDKQSLVVDPLSASSAEDYIIVTQVGSNSFGIIVDQVFDTEEIVVKPVAPILRDIPFYSGNTILGDGSVIMILDPNGISTAIGQGATAAASQALKSRADQHHEERTAFLVFKAGSKQPLAVPLGLIARLEEINVNDIEEAGHQHVVQYRGGLMPLIPADPSQTLTESGSQSVIVFTDRDRSMGLYIDEIVDIVEDNLKIELTADSSGRMGAAVINGVTTDIIDASHYLSQAYPDWFDHRPDEEEECQKQRILLVDDSQFFRDLLVPHLMVSGYEMTTARDPIEALKMRDDGLDFDFIVTDIEMPHMSGFTFAEKVRAEGRWKDTPIIALSSRTTEADLDRGRAIGFHDYISKTKRNELMSALTNAIETYEEAA